MLRRKFAALLVAAFAATALATPAAQAVDVASCDWVMPGDFRAAQACAVVMGTGEDTRNDPLLCPILASHAGAYGYYYVGPLGPVGFMVVFWITEEGDVWFVDPIGFFWDCPPYQDPPSRT